MSEEASSPVVTTGGTPLTPAQVVQKAAGSALRGGIAGATAQVANVGALMWMRTIMNYQYRYGGSLTDTAKKLYAEGGVPRFYRGLIPALMQAPLSRFGDTAANVGILALLDSYDELKSLPVGVKTILASASAASFRVVLMPIDAWKTTKQVEGKAGLTLLIQKVKLHGVSKLWHGSLGAMSATFVGHYPWFFTHNLLSKNMPQFEFQNGKYVRNAFIGFCCSVVSDTISNSLRVVKTTKQTSVEPVSYMQAAKLVIDKDGYVGLFGRGLKTRIITNGAQGALFSVAWKAIQNYLDTRAANKSA
jgi:Mitochondrial carrier protein